MISLITAFQLFFYLGSQYSFAFTVDEYNFLSLSVFVFLQYPVECFHLIAQHIGV